MGKRRNHRSDRRSMLSIVLFSTATAASGGLYVSGMIHNGKESVKRYEALKAADKAGGDVESVLNDLRGYIYTHMNTEIGGPNGIYPPIQLSGTYDRLVAVEEKRVKDINDNLYSEAQAYCEANGSQGFSGRNRLDCINQYIDTNGAKIQAIEESYYKYDFVAPRWSPDMAGFGLLALFLFGSITLLQIISYLRTKHFINLAN